MTNKLQQIMTLALATILITGTLSLMPIAYSTGSNYGNNHWDNDDDDDDNHDSKKIKICHVPPGNPNNPQTITISKSAWDAHKNHVGDYKGKCNNDDDDREDCKCRKPSTLTVKYNGPGPVDIEIYKKITDIPQKKLLTVSGSDGVNVLVSSNIFGKETLESTTVYRVMQGTTQLAVVTINTSCSEPLFIGKVYSDPNNNQVKLTIVSGEDSKGKQSIFLEHDPICEGAKLTVTKIVDDPPLNSGKFILKISKDGNPVYQSTELGNGESTGPQALMPGTYTVDESSATGTNLDEYIRTIGGDCDQDGTIELLKGDKAECIVTNTRIHPATITIQKRVTEDNTNTDLEVGTGGFSFSIKNIGNGQLIPIDSENESVPPGTYTLIEEGPENFDPVLITGDEGCPLLVDEMDPNLNEDLIRFTLSSGQHLTCVVYNEDDSDSTSGGDGIIFHRNSLLFTYNGFGFSNPLSGDGACVMDGSVSPCIERIGDKDFRVKDPKLNKDSAIVVFNVFPTIGAGNDNAFSDECRIFRVSLGMGSDLNFEFTCTEITGDNGSVSDPIGPKQYRINYAVIDTM